MPCSTPKHVQVRNVYKYAAEESKQKSKLRPFAHNVTWAKGAVHVALSRPFVDYLLHNKVSFTLLRLT